MELAGALPHSKPGFLLLRKANETAVRVVEGQEPRPGEKGCPGATDGEDGRIDALNLKVPRLLFGCSSETQQGEKK
jgi:hypothetical protein